jgi:hypothetical protein
MAGTTQFAQAIAAEADWHGYTLTQPLDAYGTKSLCLVRDLLGYVFMTSYLLLSPQG